MTSELKFLILKGVDLLAPPPFQLTLKRTHRRKTVAIQVFPDGRVLVSIPLRVSEEKVQSFIQLKRTWILKTLQKFAALGPQRAESKYLSGETFFYLGKERRLKIMRVGSRKPEVDPEQLILFLPAQTKPEQEAVKVRKILELWYKEKAHELCQARVEHFSKIMGVQPKNVQIRNYKTRWGTCKSTGEVTFNWRLAMAPLHLIDYVVVHELAHLKFHNHGPRFWQVVRTYYADPDQAKKELQSLDHRGNLKL